MWDLNFTYQLLAQLFSVFSLGLLAVRLARLMTTLKPCGIQSMTYANRKATIASESRLSNQGSGTYSNGHYPYSKALRIPRG